VLDDRWNDAEVRAVMARLTCCQWPLDRSASCAELTAALASASKA
jgi:hypothetical protein